MLEALALICAVIDGDTARTCDGERIRLTGIDAPEKPGTCRAGRQCVDGDYRASTAFLAHQIEGKRVTVRRLGRDRYGRTLAAVYANGINVACGMIAGGYAAYVRRWDEGGIVEKDCR